MSRCFPFPPPGYEAKPRNEHKDLLKKEKHKEKRHKKERKDREKRERKEKGKDQRKVKHNKKHKSEKHRDRRKNKGRDADKRDYLEQEAQNNDNLVFRWAEERIQSGTVNDSKPTDELVTQIMGQRDDGNHTGNSTGKLLPQSIGSFSEKRTTSLGRMVNKSGQTALRNHASESGSDSGHGSKTRINNGKSLQVGSAETHSTRMHGANEVGLEQESYLCFAQRSSEGVCAATRVLSGAGKRSNGRIAPSPNALQRSEQVDQYSDLSSYNAYRKSDSMITKGMIDKENGSVNNCHTRIDQQLVRAKDGNLHGKADIKEVKAHLHKGVKVGDTDHNVNHKEVNYRDSEGNAKKRQPKDKEKEKKRLAVEHRRKELDAYWANKDSIMDSTHLNDKKVNSGDVKKRRDLEAYSSQHEHSMRMTKLPRMSPANPRCVNGETLSHSHGTANHSSRVPLGINTCEEDRLQDNKESCNSCITGSHYLEEHKAPASSSGYDSNEVSLTSPHPDTKYLSQVYSIPAVDAFSECVDQGWLFSRESVQQKTVIPLNTESPGVWAEAKPIDSADIVALPYIVPF